MSAILSASPPVSRADAPAASGPWIYRPWLDLLVGCGGWSAPLLLLAFHFSDSYSRAWTVAFYFLALLFNYPHFMATVYRAYHTRTEFAKYRIFTVHVSLLLAAAGLATHLWYPLLPWIFTIYICWSPWHYTGQNFGLMVMFARRAGVSLVPAERRSLHLAFVASFLLLLLSFHTGRSNDPLVISLGLPAKLTAPARGVLAIFFLVCVAWAFRSMARRSPFRSMTPSLVLATTQFLWFLLPAVIELLRSRGIPQTRYSSGFLTFMALVNIHHFLLDGALWKLRDSRVASFLLGQGAAVGSRKSAARAPSRSLTHWLLGESSGARGLRLAAVFLLIAWAAVDQLHFYWANQPEGASLRRAALLNPRDSSVQLRLAREEHRAGHSDAALASLRLASSVSPTNLSLQEAYARGLIEAGRDADAFAEYRRILERWPESVDSLVNAGLLAARLGRGEEAIADWQRAIAIDARQMNAQLYLAQALDQSGELQAAARHYRVYISLASDPARASSVDRATVLAALIRVADADAAVNQAAEAQRGYETAIHLAEKISNRILQSLALAHLADLQERQGNVRAALLAYQQALALDATLTDATGAATDWFNYGQFLRRQHAPDALVLACFAKAR